MKTYNILIAEPETTKLQQWTNYLEKYEEFNILNASTLELLFAIVNRKNIDLIVIGVQWTLKENLQNLLNQKKSTRRIPLMIMGDGYTQHIDTLEENESFIFALKGLEDVQSWVIEIHNLLELDARIKSESKLEEIPAQESTGLALRNQVLEQGSLLNDKKTELELKENQILKIQKDQEIRNFEWDQNFQKKTTFLEEKENNLIGVQQTIESKKNELDHLKQSLNTQQTQIETQIRFLQKQKELFLAEKNEFETQRRLLAVNSPNDNVLPVSSEQNLPYEALQKDYDNLLKFILPKKIKQRLKNSRQHKIKFYQEAIIFTIFVPDLEALYNEVDHKILEDSLEYFYQQFIKISYDFDFEQMGPSNTKLNLVNDLSRTIPFENIRPKSINLAFALQQILSDQKSYLTLKEGIELNFVFYIQTGSLLSGMIDYQNFALDLYGELTQVDFKIHSPESIVIVEENIISPNDGHYDYQLIGKIGEQQESKSLFRIKPV